MPSARASSSVASRGMTATVDSELQSSAGDGAWPDEAGGPTPGRSRGNDQRWADQRGADQRRTILAVAVVAVLGAAVLGAVVTADTSSTPDTLALTGADVQDVIVDGATDAPADAATDPGAGGAIQAAALPDLEGELGQNELEPTAEPAAEVAADVESERADGGCTIGALSIRLGATGAGVTCLQEALASEGFYTATPTGTFDDATLRAAMQYQEANGLFVDGVVGRESAIELDIWPDEESLVVHTPPPPAGAMDSMGYPLSKVASTGSNAPPLPANSGSGRRVVYDRAGQRVWAVSSDGAIIRSWLVSGSKYMNEMPGVHEVYSRSDMSTAWNGKAWLPQMIRYQQTDIGHIGFHAIPLHVSDNSPYQTWEELGKRLSGGCQRQANEDANFLWEFAPVGTTVVVT